MFVIHAGRALKLFGDGFLRVQRLLSAPIFHSLGRFCRTVRACQKGWSRFLLILGSPRQRDEIGIWQVRGPCPFLVLSRFRP